MDRITMVPWRHLVNDIDLCRSPKSQKKSIKFPILAFKVIQSHWIRRQSRAVYDFVLVINSNLGPISHRYWNTATYWPKIANFAHPQRHFSRWPPSSLWKSFMVPKTRVFQAAYGVDLVILSCTLFWLIHPCDGQTEFRWLKRAESCSCFCT